MISESEIRRLRRFNRVVTSELGAMDQSFLGRGRPLGLARVLQAIGQGKEELRDLRSYLGLDSGLLSLSICACLRPRSSWSRRLHKPRMRDRNVSR